MTFDDLAALGELLATEAFGRAHEHHPIVDSTNERALNWLAADPPAPDGALVTADAQRAGRGRMGRRWASPPGEDIYASLVSRPRELRHGMGALGLAVAVGLREGLVAAVRAANGGGCPLDVGLKWPNDLVIGDRKVAGILCEARWQGRRAEVVVGFGVNVHRRRFDAELASIATSLAIALDAAGARVPGRADLLAAQLECLEAALGRYYGAGFPAIRSDYLGHCRTLGREVSLPGARPGGGALEGRAVALDHDGALLVQLPGEAAPRRVERGDVWITGA